MRRISFRETRIKECINYTVASDTSVVNKYYVLQLRKVVVAVCFLFSDISIGFHNEMVNFSMYTKVRVLRDFANSLLSYFAQRKI